MISNLTFRLFGISSLALAMAFVPACAPADEEGPNAQSSTDEGVTDASVENITDVSQTAVKRQSIGNCWLYACVGWAESLYKTHNKVELNLSESYLTYWHWFEQIANGEVSNSELSTGGGFGNAVELMSRYGLMDEGAFIPTEATAVRSEAQKKALDYINNSLKTGALKTSTARRSRTTVRKELNIAFGLEPKVVSLLDTVFGTSVKRTLDKSTIAIPANSGLKRTKEFAVGAPASGSTTPTTLADAIGKAKSSWDLDSRTGTNAWSEISWPSSASAQRTFLKRVQRALHEAQPVIISWYVDFNAMGKDSAFREPPATIGRQGGHMTLLEDYQITNVPGFGTLKAGTAATQAQKDAALADTATIEFLRIKNSWGVDRVDPSGTGQFLGYHDLYMKYLVGPVKKCDKRAAEPASLPEDSRPCEVTSNTTPFWSVVLPNRFLSP